MVKVKKKYEEGASKTFITRSRAIKKLQISIADFRRLCIFKGIYPREPSNRKKANRGKNTPNIFYYTKDIQYLLHEPLLNKFREDKIFARKLSRALVRNEVDDAKRLDANRPRYRLDTLVKERYPTFVDALRDLDDPLSMLFLFAIMPATDDVSFRVTQTANRLCHEWMAYVAREKLLKKVFVSIKGVYYQAVIKGQEVLWLVPFDFPQNVPSDIDFRVMLTFLEFYTTLVQFVLYRLYTEAGLVYPPQVDEKKMKGVGGLAAFILQSREQEGAKNLKSLTSVDEANLEELSENESDSEMEVDEEDDDEEEQNDKKKPTLSSEEIAKIAKQDAAAEDEMSKTKGAVKTFDQVAEEEEQEDVDTVKLDNFNTESSEAANGGDVLAQPSADSSSRSVGSLFSNYVFFVGREVPAKIVEFLILSCGGSLILESALDEAIANEEVSTDDKAPKKASKLPDLSKVTHQISDRPKIASKVPGRIYVQPQWIFDSINKGTVLPAAEYAPGEKLPPHLSPWGDRSGYNPEAEVSEGEDDSEDEEDEEENDEESEEEEEEEEKAARKEIAKETSGVSYSEDKKAEKADKKKKAATAAANKKRSKEEMEQQELQNIKVSMMSNKQKKIYKDLKDDQGKQEERTEKLKEKKRKIEKKANKNKK